jgi:hypothetical protein
MAKRSIYSCNFCRTESVELMGLYWMGVGMKAHIEPRLATMCENHICKTCFNAFRAVNESDVTWQKLGTSGESP